MASSREWREWHLTPDGWQRGAAMWDSNRREEGPTPPDRVKTCRWLEELTGGPSAWTRQVEELWVGDAEAAATLEAKHGPCPQEL